MNFPRLLGVAAGALCMAGACVAAATVIPESESVTLYRAPPAENAEIGAQRLRDHKYRLGQLQSAGYGKPADFDARAHVVFATQSRPVVLRSRELALPSTATPPEWRREGAMFLWHDATRERGALDVVLVGEGATAVGDYQALHVEYSMVPDTPACAVQVSLEGSTRPLRPEAQEAWSFVARTGIPGRLKLLTRIDPAQAAWHEKDFTYLLRRLAGLAPDAAWRHAQAGPLAVVQRRLEETLDDVELIDIAVAGAAVAQVNLRIAHGNASDVIEIANPLALPMVSDGGTGVRIHIAAELQKRFPGEWAQNAKEAGKFRYRLDEIVVFLRGDARTFAASKPIRGVSFLGPQERVARATGPLRVLKLASTVTPLNSYRRRLAVDLVPIAQQGRAELRGARLLLVPPEDGTVCAVRIDGVRLVDGYDGAVPAFVAKAEQWMARLGSPLPADANWHEKAIFPRLAAYLPLSTLTGPHEAAEAIEEYSLESQSSGQLVFKRLPTRLKAAAYRVLGPEGKAVKAEASQLAGTSGAKLAVKGATPTFATQAELLVIGGSPSAIALALPVDARIDGDTWFYLGAEGFTGDIVTEIESSDGRVTRRRVDVNVAVHLTAEPLHVRALRLNLTPSATPGAVIKLREIALFDVAKVHPAETVAARLPATTIATPLPRFREDARVPLDARPGRVAALIGEEPVRFTTPLDPPMTWPRGIRLSYRLPSTRSAEDCVLGIVLEWERARTERKLCLPRASDSFFVPLASLIGAEGGARDLGALRSIEWSVAAPGSGARGIEDSFELGFEIHGVRLESSIDWLRTQPILHAGGAPVFAQFDSDSRIGPQEVSRGFWLPLHRASIPLLFAGPIEQVANSPIAVDRVLLDPPASLAPERRAELLQPSPSPPPPPRLPRLLAYVAALAAVILALWLIPRIARSAAIGKLVASARSWVEPRWIPTALDSLQRIGRSLWVPLNFLVGAVALVPGLWIAGALGLEFRGAMVAATSLLFAWGAYAHLCDLSERRWLGKPPSLRSRWFAVAVTLAGAVWSIGRLGPSPEAAWAFLPLVAAAYALLPIFHGAGLPQLWRYRAWLKLVAWIAITLWVYQRAVSFDFGSGKTLLLVLGAILGIFAVRSAVAAPEAALRRHLPRVAACLYDGAGSIYFASAALALLGALLFVALRRDFPAEQFSIVAYYCMLIAAVKEIWALARRRVGDA